MNFSNVGFGVFPLNCQTRFHGCVADMARVIPKNVMPQSCAAGFLDTDMAIGSDLKKTPQRSPTGSGFLK